MDLAKLTKEELLELCDKVVLHPEGTKEELLERIENSPRYQKWVNYKSPD